MQKLLIAESSDVMTESLTDLLAEQWEIHTCSNGYAATDMIKYLQPDAMIVDLNLSKKDGLAVMEGCFPELPPVIIATTSFTSPYIEKQAESLGVGYLQRIPCHPGVIANRLTDMIDLYNNPNRSVVRHLDLLGLNAALDGYRYLLVAIPLCSENADIRLHKELYPAVRELCNATSDECVEHSIRSAIKAAWKRKNTAVWSRYFPSNQKGDLRCPSNSTFIAKIAAKL